MALGMLESDPHIPILYLFKGEYRVWAGPWGLGFRVVGCCAGLLPKTMECERSRH